VPFNCAMTGFQTAYPGRTIKVHPSSSSADLLFARRSSIHE